MLSGEPLGRAIAAAISKKGVSKADVARHFGVKPPSVQDWIKHGRISKGRIGELVAYFSDVVGPEHWGLERYLSVEEPAASYRNPADNGLTVEERELLAMFRQLPEIGGARLRVKAFIADALAESKVDAKKRRKMEELIDSIDYVVYQDDTPVMHRIGASPRSKTKLPARPAADEDQPAAKP